ncbi:MAG: hypothetical protein WC683_07445 [bacterium]
MHLPLTLDKVRWALFDRFPDEGRPAADYDEAARTICQIILGDLEKAGALNVEQVVLA